MTKRIAAVAFIYFCCCIAWVILGGTVADRTNTQDYEMNREVGRLWGGSQVQEAPTLSRLETVRQRVTRPKAGGADGETETQIVESVVAHPAALAASRVGTELSLKHRRKGLLWYPTYAVAFGATYTAVNETEEDATYRFHFRLPEGAAVFGDVILRVNGDSVDAAVEGGALTHEVELEPGKSARIAVGYTSAGTKKWRYNLASRTAGGATEQGVATIRDFSLAMTTDFRDIDFPGGTLSPTSKKRTDAGWHLTWDKGTLVTDAGIGMAMPQKLNPGPWVSRVTFFAPVSLFLFFFVVFVMTLLRGVRLHPMHYFFLGASFFAFHLLLAYLVDHVAVGVAMAIASVVSIALVVSYMRLVSGLRFALVEVGGAQLVYLVGFASTFFLEGFTGLSVTLLSIATLFVVMQATGRVDWEALLARPEADDLTERLRKQPQVAAE
ncbi:MAG: inner membrane CreD family protein [Bacteroidota bacterium]